MAPKRRPATRRQQKVEDSDKAIKSGILVCYGAQCKCAMGSAPAKLLVTTHHKYFVNDADGAEKLVATIADTQFKPPFFGNCKKMNNNPCVPAVTTWSDNSMHIEAGGNDVLLNISKATCTVAGSQNSITIIEHGQEHVLTAQNMDNAADCPELNPLLTEAAKKEIKKKLKPIGVTEIIFKHPPRPRAPTDTLNGETPATAQSTNESLPEVTVKAAAPQTSSSQTAEIEKVYVRPAQQATFKVSKYGKGNASPSNEEKQQVCWVIYKGKYTPDTEEDGSPKADILVIYENHGETLEVSFDEEAIYTMEASGGKMGDESLMLELNVTFNKPTGIKPMLAIGASAGGSLLVPTKQPIPFNALFLMPPTAEEIVPLEWWVYDSAYAMAGYQLHSKEMVQAFESPGNYTISLKYNGAAIQERQVQASFNTVKTIVLPGRAQPKMRPGTSFTAKVADMGFSVLADDWTPDQIDWYLHPPGTIIKQNIQRTLVKRNTYTETLLPYTPEQLAKMAQNFVGTTSPTGQINVPGNQLPNPGIYILEAVNRGELAAPTNRAAIR